MGYPFRGEVQQLENQEHPEIKQLSKNPNKVIREVPAPNKEWRDVKIRVYQEARDYFYNLRDRYGIAVPNIDFIAGEDERGRKNLFVVVDKISGKNVDSETWYPIEAVKEFDFFYSQLLQSFFDAYKHKQPYWFDFLNEQLVYGRKSGDVKDRLYIVDIENSLFEPSGETVESWYRLFRETLDSFSHDVLDSEAKFLPGTKFKKTHEKLKEIMEYLG